MSKAIERKQELVNQIAEEIKASSSVVIADWIKRCGSNRIT